MDEPERIDARRQVLRRVKYAMNTLALAEEKLPPEGPFDVALTNGLVSIVATEWPGEERDARQYLLSARKLLLVIRDDHPGSLPFIPVGFLLEGLNLSQPHRHGGADEEFFTLDRRHIVALQALDRHRSLSILDKARGKSVDDVLMIAYEEHAERYLPFSPKDRSVARRTNDTPVVLAC